MPEQLRQDRSGQLAAPIDARVFEGRAGRIHSPGDGLDYGDHEEYRDASGVAAIAEQLPGKPVNLYHDTTRVVGTIISAWVDGSYAVARFLITDDAALSEIESGLNDLSLGYMCQVDDAGYQRNIIIDHLAIVPVGRCTGLGGTCALRADCACQVVPDTTPDSLAHIVPVLHTQPVQVVHGAAPIPDNHMDELTKKLTEALAELAAQKARADQAQVALDAARLETRAARQDADQVDVANARADKAEKDAADKVVATIAECEAKLAAQHADHVAQLDAKVNAKVTLVAEASLILKKPVAEVARLTERAIHNTVVMHVDGDDLEKMVPAPSAEFLAGAYKLAVNRHMRSEVSRTDAVQTLTQIRNESVASAALATSSKDAEALALDALRESMRTKPGKTNATKDKE